tara:strand:+ start:1240 stop:1863 length:624 start_codon:yes stop_codon:yes gene_type:complete
MLNDYDNLIKEIIDWSHRGDLNNKIPDFIQLAENAMYSNEVAVLTVRSMETISTTLTTGQYVQLPDDFESARSVRLVTDDNGGELRFQAPEQMAKQVATGRPNFFTVVGNELQFDRIPDSEYTLEFQYYRKAPALSDDNLTNDILTNHPSIYLFGALTALFSYSQDTEQQIKYNQMFISAIKGANKADKKGRYGPAPSMSIDCGMVV